MTVSDKRHPAMAACHYRAIAPKAAREVQAMPVIDTHAHIYSPDEKRYPPIANPRRQAV